MRHDIRRFREYAERGALSGVDAKIEEKQKSLAAISVERTSVWGIELQTANTESIAYKKDEEEKSMAWYNQSPARMKREKDHEAMRRAWEAWWYGRTGIQAQWEQDTVGHIRQIYADKKCRQATGCAILVFCPSGVWYDTDHAWDSYPFDCLLQTERNGPFVEAQCTGEWLRLFTSTSVPYEIQRQAWKVRDESPHPWCQRHRETYNRETKRKRGEDVV